MSYRTICFTKNLESTAVLIHFFIKTESDTNFRVVEGAFWPASHCRKNMFKSI